MSFTVLSTADKSVTVRVENDFELGERKNMNLPGVAVDLPVLTEKDKVLYILPERVFMRVGSDRIESPTSHERRAADRTRAR